MAINKPPIKNLVHANANHTKGVSYSLYFALVADIITEPILNAVTDTGTLTDNISATGTFTFEANKGFGTIRTAKEPKLNEKVADNGSYENTLELQFLDSDEAKGFRHTYKTAQMVLVFKDGNGKFKKFGTVDFPAFFPESEAKSEDGSLIVKLTAMIKPVAILPDAFAPTAPTT